MAVFKRPNSKYYWYKFTFDGELIQQSSKCTNQAKARDVEAAHRMQLRLGQLGIKSAPLHRKEIPTFEKAAADFLKWSELNHKNKPRSFQRVKFSTAPLVERFGKKKVDTITAEEIEKYQIWRSKQISKKTKTEITADTVNMELIILKTIFRRLIAAGHIKKNPAAGTKLLPKNKRKFYVLTEDDERRYLMACTQPLQDIAVLMLETGCRPDELYNLKRQNVFIESGFLRVENGKTEAGNRKIPLSDRAAAILKHRLSKFKGEYLFPKKEKDFNPPTYELNWYHRAALSQTHQKFRIYDLRHTFASRILESGKVDLLTLAALLGHSSLDQVMRYAHPSDQSKTEAIRNTQKKAV